MEIGLVQKVDIDSEMQQAYLDYAMSVIVARALPDARDGLKPVHRRILYAMYDMGLRAESAYKKSARIVGEVLGKYHPHGDMAVYEAMARMAQDFSMRYMLVDGQGNFGSIDGDSPAAMRYTEARLAALAQNMLADIQKNTVNFDPNFDGTLAEPVVLPSAIPNLLVNGATGIAVGMATSVPPHNLGEVVDALRFMLDNWDKLDDLDVDSLMQFIQGPDFPTGGIVMQDNNTEEGLTSAYGSGRGRVTVQARAHLEEMERGRNRIIVTELPYMTNKSSLIERIADLVREERLEGIVDLRDESDRQGMRIVIELNKNVDPEAVLRNLYKHTPMQSTFSINMLALVDGEPRLLSLKQALRVYVEHRLEIVKRRSQFDLERARQRAHILEGLRVALKNLDAIIDLIRKSPDADTARTRLMKQYKLSELQAQAILDMPLRRLAALERKKIEEEYKELQAQIKDLESLLRSSKRMRQVVGDELQAVKETYGDRRRTQIVHLKEGESRSTLLTTGDLTPSKRVWITVSANGLIARSLEDTLPALGGMESPAWVVQANTRDTLYLVSESGETAALPVHAVPETSGGLAGAPFNRISALKEAGARLAAIFSLPPRTGRGENANGNSASGSEEGYVLTVTRQGMVKKSGLSELPGPSAGTFTLVRVNESDRLGWLRISSGQNEVLLATAQGMAIRFSEEEVRPMGLVAAGVMGIKLQEGDEVVGMELLPQEGEVFLVASDGSAKRVPQDQFSRQGRYGQGLLAWKLPGKERVAAMTVGPAKAALVIYLEKAEPKLIHLDDATHASRTSRGAALHGIKGAGAVTGLVIPRNSTGSLVMQAEKAGSGAVAPKAKPVAEPESPEPAKRASATAKKTPATAKKAPATKKASSTVNRDGKTDGNAAVKPPAKKAASGAPAAAQKAPAKEPVAKKGAPTAGKTKPPAKKAAAASKPPVAANKPAAGKKAPAAAKTTPAVEKAPTPTKKAAKAPAPKAAAQLPLPVPEPEPQAKPAPGPKAKTRASEPPPAVSPTPSAEKTSARSKAAPTSGKAQTAPAEQPPAARPKRGKAAPPPSAPEPPKPAAKKRSGK